MLHSTACLFSCILWAGLFSFYVGGCDLLSGRALYKAFGYSLFDTIRLFSYILVDGWKDTLYNNNKEIGNLYKRAFEQKRIGRERRRNLAVLVVDLKGDRL